MILRIVTCLYLGAACGTLWCLFRHTFTSQEEDKGARLLLIYWIGHAMAVGALYFSGRASGIIPACAVAMFPLVGWVIHRWARAFYYQGPLNLLYIGVLLSSLGLLLQFRLGQRGLKLIGLITVKGGVSVAVNLMLLGTIVILGVSYLLFSGKLRSGVEWVERRTSYPFWGLVSLVTLAVPLFAGVAVGRTRSWVFGHSGQASEWGLKVFFPIFLSLFFSRHQKEISSPGYPGRELAKILLVFFGLVSLYFLVPLVVFQREQGTALLIGFTIVAMVTYATGRWYAFPVGVLCIGMAILGATVVDPHTRERIFGGWISWEEYVRHPYLQGSNRFPGWHIAQVHAVLESASIYGRGIGQGTWSKIPALSTDFAIAPLLAEFGGVSLLIVLGGYLLILKEGLSGPPARDFRGFLRVGIPVTICCQGFFNILAVLGVVPLAGVPLPWISNGGSALLANWILLGLLAELQSSSVVKQVGEGNRS